MQLSLGHNVLMICPPGAGKTLLRHIIYDLVGSEEITPAHLAEEVQ